MRIGRDDLLLVTGATGLVGSHVVERAAQLGIRTRVLVRPTSDSDQLQQWGAELFVGDLSDRKSLRDAAGGTTAIVHCAARVGDWGPVAGYRAVNVGGLENLLAEAEAASSRKRFIHVSSLGVYEARDHYGTDESERPNARGIDGYTLSKVEAEQVVLRHIREHGLAATVLRPGFIYGRRDRTVLPRLLERLRDGKFAFLGSGEKLMNNTYVGHLVDAIFLAIEHDEAVGEVYNVTDGRLVTKREFITTVAEAAGFPVPTKKVPLGVARVLAKLMEATWRLVGKQEAPLLSSARVKFLGLNLDFSIHKARRELGYHPQADFTECMKQTIAWFREQKIVSGVG